MQFGFEVGWYVWIWGKAELVLLRVVTYTTICILTPGTHTYAYTCTNSGFLNTYGVVRSQHISAVYILHIHQVPGRVTPSKTGARSPDATSETIPKSKATAEAAAVALKKSTTTAGGAGISKGTTTAPVPARQTSNESLILQLLNEIAVQQRQVGEGGR